MVGCVPRGVLLCSVKIVHAVRISGEVELGPVAHRLDRGCVQSLTALCDGTVRQLGVVPCALHLPVNGVGLNPAQAALLVEVALGIALPGVDVGST